MPFKGRLPPETLQAWIRKDVAAAAARLKQTSEVSILIRNPPHLHRNCVVVIVLMLLYERDMTGDCYVLES